MNCRLQTTNTKFSGTISPQISIQLHHNFTIKDSFTAVANNITLQQAPVSPNKAKPIQFQIDNPQIINKNPRVNYVGPLFIDFTSSATGLYG